MHSVFGTPTHAKADLASAKHTAHGVRWLSVLLVLLSGMTHATDARTKTYADLPLRKAGLWEVKVQAHAPAGMGGRIQPAMTVLQCTDATAERAMPFLLLPPQEGCRRITVSRNGKAGHAIGAVCESHGQRMDMALEFQGDMQSRYAGTYSIQYPGSPSNSTGKVPFESRWLGRCKPGQRAGDMVLPNGATVNPIDDARRARGHAH